MQQPPPLPAANPYAAPSARVVDVVSDDLVLADRGIRLLAWIVDGLVLAAPMMVIGIVAVIFAGVMSRNSNGTSETMMTLMFIAFGFGALVVLIINMVLLHRNGQTIAKRWFGIKVVRLDGSRCSLPRILFARWLPVTLLGMIPVLGYGVALVDSLMIFRNDYRCLHDLIADTIVVKA
jgi:uncharacterized RDD family membrane protein YckC